MFKGVLASVAASFLFGAIYYISAHLAPLDGEQIFGWRVVLNLPLTTALLLWRKELGRALVLVRRALVQPGWALVLLFSSAMLGAQMWLFMWAPMHGKALPVSLGYFLLPLVMVLVGKLFFHESLTRLQSVATALAAAGVVHEFWRAGGMDWETWFVALGYAVYFSMRRRLRTDHLAGHWLDMALMLPAALYFIFAPPPSWPLVRITPALWWLLPLLGVVSAVALALYMLASRKLPIGLFGLLAYVEPVLLVVVAWLLGESLAPGQDVTYGLIFTAVGLLVADGAWHMRRGRFRGSR
jgi:chloramphenicol-sensitive protein RarD